MVKIIDLKNLEYNKFFLKNSQWFLWYVDQKLHNKDLSGMPKSYLKLHNITINFDNFYSEISN